MGIFKQTKDKITAASENAVKKTKLVADFAMEKASNVMNDENIADFVISATKKQESINEELKKRSLLIDWVKWNWNFLFPQAFLSAYVD